jgi:hypothetical protein
MSRTRIVLSFLSLVAGVMTSSPAAAQAVPVPAATPALEIGLEQLAGPVARLGFSPRGGGLVVGRVDVGARVVGVAFGGQWDQRLFGALSLREAASIGPFVSASGPPGVGVSAEGLVQLGIDVGDVLLLVGPRLQGNALVQGAVPGRGVLDAVVAVRVPLFERLALTALASAGAERAHVGFVPGGSALAGGVAVGLQWRP